jgi:hypothetical protein
MRKFLICFFCIIITFNVGVRIIPTWNYFLPPYEKGTHKSVSYMIPNDNGLNPFIEIEVDANVSSEELCATLAEVADKHQNDAAREYWVTEYLTVRAYLVKDGKRSYFQSGTLHRYIPVRYPVPETKGKPDEFYTQVWLAKLSL